MLLDRSRLRRIWMKCSQVHHHHPVITKGPPTQEVWSRHNITDGQCDSQFLQDLSMQGTTDGLPRVNLPTW